MLISSYLANYAGKKTLISNYVLLSEKKNESRNEKIRKLILD